MANAVAAGSATLTTAANGIGIPYPDSTGYTTVTSGARSVLVPENMVFVPAGSFTYGTGATATTMSLDDFCIGRFEVTNAEYKVFLDATGSRNYPMYWSNGTYPEGKANHPLLFVSLVQANAYAAWIAQRTGWKVVVPTAFQWEKAARGPAASLYPWGNTLDATYANGVLTAKSNFNANVTSYYLTHFAGTPATYNNANSTHYNQTVTVGAIAAYSTTDAATPLSVSASAAVLGYVDHNTYTGFIYTDVFSAINSAGGFTEPVGGYEAGKSAYGSYDMAGNAYEWTTTTFVASNGAEAGQTVNEVRGGGWYSNGTSGQSIDTGEGRSATGGYNSVGFRVAVNGTVHPAFFKGETALDNAAYYLQFPGSANIFGYYTYLQDPNYLYHFDLGFEYLFDATDGLSGAYLYDFKSGGFFYTSPVFPFPYLYDFALNSVVFYYPDPDRAGRYSTNGARYFYVFGTGQIVTK